MIHRIMTIMIFLCCSYRYRRYTTKERCKTGKQAEEIDVSPCFSISLQVPNRNSICQLISSQAANAAWQFKLTWGRYLHCDINCLSAWHRCLNCSARKPVTESPLLSSRPWTANSGNRLSGLCISGTGDHRGTKYMNNPWQYLYNC